MEPGTLIASKYRLTERLGEGATGVVFAARHEKTGSEVALKIVKAERATARRALREARAACAVQHENLVSVQDVFEEPDGTTVLVMERLRGSSLKAHLAKRGKLDGDETRALARGLFAGLEALHDAGVVHRDLKPDNVFLVDDDASRVRILDFGIAKLRPELEKTETALTASGAMLGTPRYMAPEQAFGEADVDARADLWAAGAVLYECLTGSLPAPGDNLGQIMKRLASGSIVPLASHGIEVAEPLRGLIDALLVIDRDARLGSARQAIARLEARESKGEPARGRRIAIAIALGLGLVGGALGLAAIAQHDGSPDVVPSAPMATVAPVASPSAAVVAPSTTSVPATTSAPSAVPRPTVRPVVSASAPASASASAPAVQPTSRILPEPPF